MMNKPINTGLKYCRQRILLTSTGDDTVDAALKSMFIDDWNKTAPLSMSRSDVACVCAWMKTEDEKSDAAARAGLTVKEMKQGQLSLLENLQT